MKKIIFLFSTVLLVANTNAQDKYFTKTGKISFDATVPKSPENIVAVNKATTMVLDTKTGEMQFVVLGWLRPIIISTLKSSSAIQRSSK